MKLAGATYLDVHKAGGGINFTVRHTKATDEEELLRLLLGRMKKMMQYGTTMIEGKSGYGLETETELKMLRVLHRAGKVENLPEIVSTFCGAHSVPTGMTPAEATDGIGCISNISILVSLFTFLSLSL